MPPTLKIRSPQRIVSLQHLHHQIEFKSLSIDASRSSAIDTIVRDPVCFKHYISHCTTGCAGYLNLTTSSTVLRERRTMCPAMWHKRRATAAPTFEVPPQKHYRERLDDQAAHERGALG